MSFLRAKEAHRQKKKKKWLKATAVLVAVIYGVLEEVPNQQGEEAIALALCAWLRAAAVFFLHTEKRASGPAPALGLPPARSVKLFWVS